MDRARKFRVYRADGGGWVASDPTWGPFYVDECWACTVAAVSRAVADLEYHESTMLRREREATPF